MNVGTHEAKTRLSELLRRVETGEEIVILRGDKPIARLVPVRRTERRRFGRDEGVFAVPEDFDAPLPDHVLGTFEA
ncbi:MAG: type II toxin-antitoxin system Phd/YefM family antitoxin [Mycobacteriales bacterium]